MSPTSTPSAALTATTAPPAIAERDATKRALRCDRQTTARRMPWFQLSLSTLTRPRLHRHGANSCSWPKSPVCFVPGLSVPPPPSAGHPAVPSCSRQPARPLHAHCQRSGDCAARYVAVIRLPMKSQSTQCDSKAQLTGKPIRPVVVDPQSGW
jgi:hypothetical protein